MRHLQEHYIVKESLNLQLQKQNVKQYAEGCKQPRERETDCYCEIYDLM